MQALGWPAINGRNTLSEGQPVIVLGTLQMSVDINGLDDGRAEQYFIAEVIYAGTLAEFQRFMPRFAIIPTMTLVVSVLSAFVVIATPFLYLRTLQQRSDDVQQISEPQQSTA
jgi:hypothetical protein